MGVAKLAVAAIIRVITKGMGFTPSVSALAIAIGKRTTASAVFDRIDVKTVVNIKIMESASKGWLPLRSISCSAIRVANPVFSTAAPKAIDAAITINT